MKPSRIAIAGIGILTLASCSSTATSRLASPAPGSPNAGQPQPAKTVHVVYDVGFISSQPTNSVLHEVTITDGKATDRVVLANQRLSLLDARGDVALVVIESPIPGGNGATTDKLATVQLKSGAVQMLGIDGTYSLYGVLSPDATQAAVESDDSSNHQKISIVQVATGESRTLSSSNALVPLVTPVRWATSGLAVTKGYPDGPAMGLFAMDLHSGALTTISTAPYEVLSPSQKFQSYSGNTALGDSPCNCQGDWNNTLSVAAIGGKTTMIASEKNRNFGPIDVSDDGNVLYSVDGDSTTVPSDGGLYYYANGHATQQFSESVVGQWGTGAFVGPSAALVGQSTTPYTGATQSMEVDLVQLCTASPGCQPSLSRVAAVSGTRPIISKMVVMTS